MSLEEQVDSQTIDTQESTQSNETTDNTKESQDDGLQYEKGVKLSEKLQKQPDLEDIVDLGKLPKFKWNGKTLTAKELQNMAMMQSDYTKKTQEISQNKKYYENLYHDLNYIKNNPDKVEEFRKVYPKSFHSYLDSVMADLAQTTKPQGEAPTEQKTAPDKSQTVDPRFDEVYNFYKEQRQQSTQEKVDALFDRLTTKFPNADEEKVISRVQILRELSKKDPSNYKEPNDQEVEKLFKQDHEAFEKRLQDHTKRILDEQRKANARGRAPGPGGAIPGQAPKIAKSIREATELALQDPNL